MEIGGEMDNSQLSDFKVGQIMAESSTIFKDGEFFRNILGVEKEKVYFFLIVNVFAFGVGVGHLGQDI